MPTRGFGLICALLQLWHHVKNGNPLLDDNSPGQSRVVCGNPTCSCQSRRMTSLSHTW